jgi:hypothetical protein
LQKNAASGVLAPWPSSHTPRMLRQSNNVAPFGMHQAIPGLAGGAFLNTPLSFSEGTHLLMKHRNLGDLTGADVEIGQ